MYETIEIESFSQFIEILEEDTQFDMKNVLNGITLYRGQNCDLPLLPKIGRFKKPVSEILEIEMILINEFEKRCQPSLDFELNNAWDLLAYAQHFGLPTRLLDWTENPLVALWFAVSSDNYGTSNGVVWIFDVDYNDIVIDLDEDPLKIKKAKVFDPSHINKRITSQLGWFTVHKLKETIKSFVPLERNNNYKDALTKLVIPQKLYHDFRLKLNKMGVNQATIYADLDGLCKHLEWKYLS